MSDSNAALAGFLNHANLISGSVLERSEFEALVAVSGLITGAVYRVGTPEIWYRATDSSTYTQFADVGDSPVQASESRFGGYWDLSGDDMPAVEAAADYAASFDPPRSVVLPPVMGIGSSAFIPERVSVVGNDWRPGKMGTSATILASMSLSTGYAFNFNTTDGINADVAPSPWKMGTRGGLFGIFVDNTPHDMAGARLAVFACSFHAEDIWGFYMVQMVKQAASAYVDRLHILRCGAHRSLDNSEFLYDVGAGGGDAALLEVMTFSPYEINGEPDKAIKVYGSGSGSIRNMVNGQILIDHCPQFLISNLHCEAAKIVSDWSNLIVEKSTLETPTGSTYYPIECKTTSTTTINNSLTLSDVGFKYGLNDREGTPDAEVKLSKQITLTTRHAYRSIHSSNGNGHIGIRVNDDTDTPVDEWNRYSGWLSENGQLVNLIPVGKFSAPMKTNDFLGVYNAVTKVTGFGTSTFTNGQVLYYKAQLLLDPVAMIGLNQSGELTVTMSASNAANERNFAPIYYGTDNAAQATIRLYRGGSSGNYDLYCDFPALQCRSMQDSGDYVNGLPWINRGSGAGAVDTIYGSLQLGYYEIDPMIGAIGVGRGEPANVTNADATIGLVGYWEQTVVLNSALSSSAKNYTINSAITRVGSRIKFVRTASATGAFDANLKDPSGTTLKALASAGTYAEAELCNGSVWRLVGYGTL